MNAKNGFTLIELIAVIGIIMTLTAIGIPAYRSWQGRSQRAEAISTIAKLEMALEMFRTDTGNYPADLNEQVDGADWFVPYTDARGIDLTDPWGDPYVYEVVSDGRTFTVRSDNL